MNKEELYKQVKDKWNQAEGMPAVILPLVDQIISLEDRIKSLEKEIKKLTVDILH